MTERETCETAEQPRKKFCYIGPPGCFELEMAMKHVGDAFGRHCSYVVGSTLERPDWRDVDVRMILDDDEFAKLFPNVDLKNGAAVWEFDPRWLLLNVAITDWLRKHTGLPVDFQMQPRTFANERHKKKRNAVGLTFAPPEKEQP